MHVLVVLLHYEDMYQWIIVLLFAESFDDDLRRRICKGFLHSGFCPGLRSILVSICVHAFLPFFFFMFRCIDDDVIVLST